MSQRAALLVNGETKEFDADSFPNSVSALAASLGIDVAMVVAEVNGEIVRRQDFPSRNLNPGDKVELVRFVGGG